MPAIVSDRVGCANEMVIEAKTGYVLELNKELWKDAIMSLMKIVFTMILLKTVTWFDFETRDKKQVDAFV